MPLSSWIRGRRVEAEVAHRVEAMFGLDLVRVGDPAESRARSREPGRVARLELPGRFAAAGSRIGARLGLRLDPGRRAAAAVGLAAVVAVLMAGAWVSMNRPHTVAVGVTTPARAAAASTDGSTASVAPSGMRAAPASTATVVVDIVGKVVHPGVYRLPAGSRVDDAVRAAGGALPGVDLTALNLAQVVSDGQQIAVAVAGAPAAAGDNSGGGPAGGPVNLNTATSAQLDALPGVGPVLAQHILSWRTEHGQFTSVDQLREVSGIGEAKYQDLKSLVTV